MPKEQRSAISSRFFSDYQRASPSVFHRALTNEESQLINAIVNYIQNDSLIGEVRERFAEMVKTHDRLEKKKDHPYEQPTPYRIDYSAKTLSAIARRDGSGRLAGSLYRLQKEVAHQFKGQHAEFYLLRGLAWKEIFKGIVKDANDMAHDTAQEDLSKLLKCSARIKS